MASDKKILQLFKEGSEPDANNKAEYNIKGNQNTVIQGNNSGDININQKKVVRPKIITDERHISESDAAKIKSHIDDLVLAETASGVMSTASAYAKWYGALKRHYEVASYRMIPAGMADSACNYLKQQKGMKRSKLRRTNNEEWRKQLTKAIHSKRNGLGMSKGEMYAILEKRLELSVISITQLSDKNLKKFHSMMMGRKKNMQQ